MTNARDKANIPVLNFQSKGIDDNADATAITINSSEQVGIGTTSMDGILHLDDGASTNLVIEKDGGGAGSIRFHNDGTSTSYIQLDASEDMVHYGGSGVNQIFYANANERMRLTTTGLALKTSAPAVTLDVRATSFTPYNTNTSLIVEAPAVFSQAQHFYIYNAGSYNSSRPTGGIGAVNASSLISLSAGSICTANPGADGFKATATSSSLYDIGSGNHEFKTKTGLTVGDQFTHVTRMIIKDSGSVGIGTTNPQEQLDISSNSPRIRFSDTSVTDLHHKIGSEANDLEISCDAGNDQASSHIGFKVDGSEKMRIASGGNISFGTTQDQAKVQITTASSGVSVNAIADELFVEGSGDSGITIGSGTSGTGTILFGDSGDNDIGKFQYNHSDNSMVFSAGAGERMRVTGDGHVLFNCTSLPSASVPGAGFEKNGTASVLFLSSNTTSTSNVVELFNPNGNVGTIRTSGSSTIYNTSSDYRLKENVNYDFDATSRLKQLKPARFNFIADADTTVDGFIAHEVSSIVPEAISGEKDAVNEDGSINPQGIDQSKLVPLLVKTIQELEARITTLENA